MQGKKFCGDGSRQRKMKKITQKEIAAKLGLHVRTISRVLNHEDSVKEETRRRVVAELNRNGYFFQTHTRPEVVAVDIRPGYLERQALRLIEMLSNRDLQFRITNHNADLHQFYDTAEKSNVMVFCSTPEAKIVDEVAQRCPGIYRINLFSHGVPGAEVSIEPDNDKLGKRSARYLAEHGHRDIMVISSQENIATLERTKSFLGELEVSFPEIRCRTVMAPLNPSLAEKINDILAERDPKTTAIYCPGFYIARQTCQALSQLRYRVPEEISILVNDLPEEFPFPLPFRPDTFYSRTSDIIELAEFYITNRFMLKSASSITASPGIELRVSGTVARIGS